MLGQPRSTQRYQSHVRGDEEALTKTVVKLAQQYGHYGYRHITTLLRVEGWRVNHKRVERIWRQEGLKVPRKQPKRSLLWVNEESCIQLRSAHRDHVWAYDFVATRTHEGRPLRLLTIVDEYTRDCLASEVAQSLRADDVLHRLAELFLQHGRPEYILSDNGPEFTAKAVRPQTARSGHFVYRTGQPVGKWLQ